MKSDGDRAAATDVRSGDPTKRHRHDIGQVDHGPHATEAITRGIQGVLGLAIAATLGLVGYSVYLAAST